MYLSFKYLMLTYKFYLHSQFLAYHLCTHFPDIPLTHRILDPNLGGGALLDL